MRILALLPLACVLASGCSYYRVLFPGEEPAPPCDSPLPWYPDEDGDGTGATDRVYLGCEAPSGWVELTGDCDDSDASVIECGDTGDPGDTGETGDTGNAGDTGKSR